VCLLTNIPGFATVKYKIDYLFDPVGNVTNRVIMGLQGVRGCVTTSGSGLGGVLCRALWVLAAERAEKLRKCLKQNGWL
jgi:hypothetical protein